MNKLFANYLSKLWLVSDFVWHNANISLRWL